MTASDNYQALMQLIGLPLRGIGRSCNLLWLHFGEWREIPARGGGIRTVGQWALHVQCEWSFSKATRLIVSSADYYLSPKGDALGDDWDIPGSSLFDQTAKALRVKFEAIPSRVTSVVCGRAGQFSLYFDDEGELIVIPDETRPEEAWRLFEPGADKRHFVVSPIV